MNDISAILAKIQEDARQYGETVAAAAREKFSGLDRKIPVKIQPRQGRLPALEQKADPALRRARRLLQQGPDHLGGHAPIAWDGPVAGLVGVKAVGTAQIAGAGGRLD